ncbi:MAG: GNAT family N-acetyltransferase [Candidatus Gracilibacteria bacterium]|nr:GNAT family N-acetyltransferase [Candidatus Gracilibacteria bacterium]
MEFSIVEVQESDNKEIIQLGKSTPECQDHDGPPSFLTEHMMSGYIKSPHDLFLKAISDAGKLLGIIMVSYSQYTKVAYVENIIVKAAYRKKGIASMLMDHALENLNKKGCVDVWALVHEDNEYMLEFTKRRGYKKGRKFFLVEKSLGVSEE